MTDNQDATKDNAFASRIQNAIGTVEPWDDDPSLLAECRLMIPFAQLLPELYSKGEGEETEKSPYLRDDDALYRDNWNALFLKRLTLHFQKDVMTWFKNDGLEYVETRGPETLEEKEGQAMRVEVYKKKDDSGEEVTITFPRYNSCRKLLETRQGRCGEYANLFGLYCRACGYETRYVSDWTDHVWIEVLVGDEWIMADSCEGTINLPSMYESGWGKKLNYIVAISASRGGGGGVTDVTPRYTRQFQTTEFQQRRRQIASSEQASDQIVQRFQDRVRQNLPPKTIQNLTRRDQLEKKQLDAYKSIKEWTEAEKHGRGRISGSLEWKLSRNEAGTHQNGEQSSNSNSSSSSVRALSGEQMYPSVSTVRIEISCSKGITVSGIRCDIGQPKYVSVVIVDDIHLGCILQSRSFTLWRDVASFLQTIPLGRIVALEGCTKEETLDEGLSKQLEILEGFQLPAKPSDGMVFLGRLGAKPEWTFCGTSKDDSISVEFPKVVRSAQTKLRKESKKVPHKVVGRLPESVMPLQTQLLASEAQKRAAFLSYVKDHPNIVGYTTKESSPVYLMDNTSFPFQDTVGDWSTFHYLPEVLVPENEEEHNNGNNGSATDLPKFDLPLEDNFFQSLLGPTLLVKSAGSAVSVPTSDALRHTRLVGLYFSAHWCPPCKRFTPMLSEMYALLKEQNPYHGLEIVFVTSDRSSAEFNQYYAAMPWVAVPFDETKMRQQSIGMRYGVRGIPALVILDAVSGQVVASIDQARNEVSQACSRGDTTIEDLFEKSWLGRLPAESIELFNLLKMSSMEGESADNAQAKEEGSSAARDAYLTINKDLQNNPWANNKPTLKNLDFGVVATGKANDTSHTKSNGSKGTSGDDDAKVVLTTMLKYLDNAVREPWNPKFRQFKLSNKIVDKATRLDGAIDLICSFGMTIVPTTEDFMLSIPLGSDLDRMQSAMTTALKDLE